MFRWITDVLMPAGQLWFGLRLVVILVLGLVALIRAERKDIAGVLRATAQLMRHGRRRGRED